MATTAKPRVTFKAPKWSEEKKREFDSISRRADTFAKRPPQSLFDKDGNATDPGWAKILSELDDWARRHKVELNQTERDLATIVPVPAGDPVPYTSACPVKTVTTETYTGGGITTKMKFTCFLKRQTLLGRCVYNCSYEFV
jgi:hypothetical protein